jgi:hypothetical protein
MQLELGQLVPPPERVGQRRTFSTMQWSRSNALGLAKASCFSCKGLGIRVVRKDKEVACNCVLRAIFRACFNRFRLCVISAEHIGSVSLDYCPGPDGRRTYGRKREEYMADFCLVSRRYLEPTEYQLFKYHFLMGANWKLCCRRLEMDRGTFFHSVYRIEHRLGQLFASLRPYPLYPLTEYFGGLVARERRIVLPEEDLLDEDLERQLAA